MLMTMSNDSRYLTRLRLTALLRNCINVATAHGALTAVTVQVLFAKRFLRASPEFPGLHMIHLQTHQAVTKHHMTIFEINVQPTFSDSGLLWSKRSLPANTGGIEIAI